jgi:ABC-type branched-subunit amino acid transport system ATPase component
MNAERRPPRHSPDRSTAPKILQVENLAVAYSGGSISALDGINLDVYEGEIVALLGVNGAGKTTLLRAVSGLLGMHGGAVRGGSVSYRGQQLGDESAWSRVRRGISISLEGRRVFTDLTVQDNLKAGGYIRSKSASAAAYKNVVDLFPVLARKRDLPAGLLSGGEQQMLAVGRALMQGPKLLLLDEPSLGLAPLIVNQIRDIVVEINGQGCSVLLIEQNVATALSIADYAYVLDSRMVEHHGTAQEMLADDTLRDLYLGIASPSATDPKLKNGAVH